MAQILGKDIEIINYYFKLFFFSYTLTYSHTHQKRQMNHATRVTANILTPLPSETMKQKLVNKSSDKIKSICKGCIRLDFTDDALVLQERGNISYRVYEMVIGILWLFQNHSLPIHLTGVVLLFVFQVHAG